MFIRTNEPAFTNLTIFDREYLVGLFGDRKYQDGTYVIDYIEEIIQFQKDFMEQVAETRKTYMFTFPVLTFALLWDEKNKDFADMEFSDWCIRHNLKWFDSNFYVGKDITTLSSCCRLTSNLNDVHTHKLEGNVSSIGGSALSIGSIKVSTINLVRVGLKAKLNKFEFFDKLKEVVEINMIALDRQRHIIKRNIEKGLLPMYTYGLMKMENQYSTIGINGMYNLVKLMGYVNVDEFGFEHISDEGISFMDKILDTLNELKDNHSYDYSFNIESIPAEKASVVFAAKDKLMFPDAKINTNLYANQYIDLRSTTSMSERIRLSGRFDTRVGGGNILHINLEGEISYEKAKSIVYECTNNGVIYFALTGKINSDKNGHNFLGKTCPVCGEEPEQMWQRIVGYYTPTKNWGKERRQESKERLWYEE